MLLENLLCCSTLAKNAKETIWLVISQINLLLCIVNDSLDLRLIDQNRFVPKIERFNPRDTFKLILDIFSPQVKMINSSLKLVSLERLPDPQVSFSLRQ